MNGFFKTLIEPDWDDSPKKSEIIEAAQVRSTNAAMRSSRSSSRGSGFSINLFK